MSVGMSSGAGVRDARLFPLVWLIITSAFFLAVIGEFFGESQDWQNYVNLFDALRASGVSVEGTAERVEIGFKLLALSLLALSLSNLSIYAVVSALSLFLKCVVINAFTTRRTTFVIAVGFYFVCVVPLHELTQVRAALAISMLFLAYVFILRRSLFLAIMSAAISVLFHISAVAILPLLLFVFLFERKVITLTRFTIFILALAAYLTVASVVSILLLNLEDILLVVEAYLEEGFGDEKVNPFSATVLLSIAISALALLRWPHLSPNMRYILLFELCGLGVFYATIGFPVIALRLYELSQAFWVLFVVEGLKAEDALLRLSTWMFALLSMGVYGYIYFLGGTFFL
ncbi:MAG: hypothetical protein FJ184_07165 [Gammaproteobacteria bacterium]|nr:hypothetical protein [Gammaproteobacteria bacterium]